MFCLFLPESPRWLYVQNKQESAKAMLTKYHGNHNPDSIWVQLQLREYEEYLNMDGADKRWWDYRALFRSRASCYRLACNCTVSIFGQWAGNGLVSYFFSAVLKTAGVTDDLTQLNYLLGYSCWQFAFAIGGAFLVDRLGRRPLLLFTNIGCTVVWVCVSVASSQYFAHESAAAAKAVIGFIFIFGAVYSVGFTPLQALYPVEVLSFEMRAKGMAFSNLAQNAAGLLNQFAWPVSIQKITWKTYIVFTVWCAVQATVIYFFIPETKNRTVSFFSLLSTIGSFANIIDSSKNLMRSSPPRIPARHQPRRRSLVSIPKLTLSTSKLSKHVQFFPILQRVVYQSAMLARSRLCCCGRYII